MRVEDIMTRDVVAVGPEASLQEVAALLVRHRISGVPVTTADKRLLGIISEGDLVERAEFGAEPRGKWWLEHFNETQSLASRFAKAHGATAADVMTRQVASVGPGADLAEVAGIFHVHGVKRVPVVVEGRLVGIVTRGDLVKVLSSAPSGQIASPRSEGELQRVILERMRAERWLDTSYVNVSIEKGAIVLGGSVGSADEQRALHVLVGEVAAGAKVVDHLQIGLPRVTEF